MTGLILLLALLMPAPLLPASPLATSGSSDLTELLRDTLRQQKKLDILRRDYTFNEKQEEDVLDNKGNVKQHKFAEYDVTYVGQQRIRRLISREGKPLSEPEQRQELAHIEKEVKKAQSKDEKDPDADDDAEAVMNSFLCIMRLTNPRHGQLNGRAVTICNFERDPAAKPKRMEEKVMQKVSGTIWIDEATHSIVRFEGRLDQGFRVGGGILGSLHEGSNFSLEQVRVNDEIWFPSVATLHLEARVVFSGIRKNVTLRNSNFQRFHINTSSVVSPPAAH